jgi:Arm DNA-binding domain
MHGSIGNNKTNATTAGRYRAGPNLYKQIAASGSGSWVLRYELRGAKRWMGLGPLAVFSLKEALQRAREAQQLIYSGVDPIDARRNQRASEARKAILTVNFEAATQAYFDQHQTKWGAKARVEFLNTLSAYAFPVLGKLPVDQVDTPLVRSFHRRNAQPADPIRIFKNWPLRYWTQAFLGYLGEAAAESNHKFADL